MHPGGSKILTDLGGTDATEKFWALHKQEILLNWAPRLKVGTIEDADAEEIDSLGTQSLESFTTLPHLLKRLIRIKIIWILKLALRARTNR